MDWKKLKKEFNKECVRSFTEMHYGATWQQSSLSPHDLFNWFKNKLEPTTFCFICNDYHAEGECMKIKPVKGISWVSTGTIDDWVVDVLEEGVNG